jgi:hypothetical protein
MERSQIGQRLYSHRDLVDQVRVVVLRPAGHQRDLVVRGGRVRAEEDHAAIPVLLGDLHAEEVTVERDHPLQIAHVDADVSESDYAWHRCLPVPSLELSASDVVPSVTCLPACLPFSKGSRLLSTSMNRGLGVAAR